MTTDRKIGIYSRVSSKTQDTRAQDMDLKKWQSIQDRECRWFSEKKSGKSMERPGFTALMAAVNAGEIDTVVVWRLDRLGRTASGLTKLFEELRSAKVNLISLKDALDLSTAA